MSTDLSLKSALGATLRKLRHERDLKLVTLSSKSHVSIGHISEIERGKTTGGFEMIQSIADGLELTTTELVKEIYEFLKEQETD